MDLDRTVSNYDIMSIFGKNNCLIITYKQLTSFDSLEDLFAASPIVFLLYETRDSFGHWCLLCTDKKHIYFFDSYGIFPDEELKYTNKTFRKNNKMMIPYLTELLLKQRTNKIMEYNAKKLQKMSPSIATCGRWCILYALSYKYINIDDFANFFLTSGENPDELITKITNNLLPKSIDHAHFDTEI